MPYMALVSSHFCGNMSAHTHPVHTTTSPTTTPPPPPLPRPLHTPCHHTLQVGMCLCSFLHSQQSFSHLTPLSSFTLGSPLPGWLCFSQCIWVSSTTRAFPVMCDLMPCKQCCWTFCSCMFWVGCVMWGDLGHCVWNVCVVCMECACSVYGMCMHNMC